MDKTTALISFVDQLIAYFKEYAGDKPYDLSSVLQYICKVLKAEATIIVAQKEEGFFVETRCPTELEIREESLAFLEDQDNQDDEVFSLEAPEELKNLNLFPGKDIQNIGVVRYETGCPASQKKALLIINKDERFYGKGGPFFVSELLYFLKSFITFIKVLNERLCLEINDLQKKIGEVFWGGSRKVLYHYTIDFLKRKEEAEKFLSTEEIDQIEWIYWDTKTQIKILPSHNLAPIFSEDSDIEVDGADGLFSQFSRQRHEIYARYKEGTLNLGQVKERLSEKIKAPEKKVIFFSLERKPQFKNFHLPQEIVEKIYKFYLENHLKIESIRTELFRLHYISLNLERDPDPEVKKAVKEFFDQKGCEELRKFFSEFLALWQDKAHSYVTTEWLITWFGIKFLKEYPWEKISLFSPLTLGSLLKHLTAYFLYVLHVMRTLGEPTLLKFSDIRQGFSGFLEAALYLISEFAYEVYGLDREFPLYESLSHLWTSEVILYSLKPSYRDHLHHVINVCLLGLAFIEAGFLEKFGKKATPELAQNWIVAGLLHDIGYCVDLPQYLIDHIKKIAISPCTREYCRFLETSLSEAERNLYKDLNQWLPKEWRCDGLDHGVISAFYILFARGKNFKNPEQSLIESWRKDLDEACLASISHNLPSDYESERPPAISPCSRPLSFLLLICDHIQEWDRPRVKRLWFERYLVSDLLSRSSLMFLGSGSIIRHLKTNLLWEKDQEKISAPDKEWEISLIYKDTEVEPSLEPALIWVYNTFDFQKVDLSEWPEDFSFKFTCVNPRASNQKYWEFDLFWDFVTQKNISSQFSRWLTQSQKRDNWFTYEREENKEKFSFLFKKQKKGRAFKNIPENLYSQFVTWKNFFKE